MNAQSEPAINSFAITWRRALDNKSFEICRFIYSRTGLQLSGTILAVHEIQPIEAYSQIFCDSDWRTREVKVEQRNGLVESDLQASVNAGISNRIDRGRLTELVDLLADDIELGPAMNPLPHH